MAALTHFKNTSEIINLYFAKALDFANHRQFGFKLHNLQLVSLTWREHLVRAGSSISITAFGAQQDSMIDLFHAASQFFEVADELAASA